MRGFFALIVVFEVSCAQYPGGSGQYQRLAAQIGVDHSPNDIIGEWRQASDDVFGDKTTNHVLFQKGGKGHSYSNVVDGWLRYEDENVGKFTWKYAGNGEWTMARSEVRMTKDKSRLLVKTSGNLGTQWYFVFVRQ